MNFRDPLLLLLLLPGVVALSLLMIKTRRTLPVVRWSALVVIPESVRRAGRWRLLMVQGFVILSWILAVIGFAGPQIIHSYEKRYSEGVDIMIALDVSGSMRSVDDPAAIRASHSQGYYHDTAGILTNRLQHARRLTADFLRKRMDDRLGLTVFAGYAITKCPLTFDHELLQRILSEVDFTDVQQQSTAIGMAMANSLQRLVSSKAKSRVLILVTDGVNNAGTIDPETATEMAKALGVKVYTVGVGSDEPLLPTQKPDYYVRSQTVIDEDSLKGIAEKTGGAYFRAADARMLENIYAQIDSLEKSMIERKYFFEREEFYQPFILAALASLVISLILRHCVFRILPGGAV
ncbi:MAG TPA: VWA domain-containing protein [Spirochaetota bacterium]|nr:VWA domain-containing protein [Spirochaetota bacterium]HPN82508.1 VWA domain-containing protein [Spirochaetota bacterium]